MHDHASLDIYRLKFLTGTMASKDEYITLAQLDLQLGFPPKPRPCWKRAWPPICSMMTAPRSFWLLPRPRPPPGRQPARQGAGRRQCDGAGRCAGQDRRGQIGAGQGQGRRRHHPGRHEEAAEGQGQGRRSVLGMAYLAPARRPTRSRPLKADQGRRHMAAMVAHLWSLYARASRRRVPRAAPAPSRTGQEEARIIQLY